MSLITHANSGYYSEMESRDAGRQSARNQDILFYPGMYAPSGFDVMKILYQVATRPNPVIDLGPVDASCPIVLCDLFLPDTPVVYASDSFLVLTGYSQDEILGRNCRFLQSPPSSTSPSGPSMSYFSSTPMPHAHNEYTYSHYDSMTPPSRCISAHTRQLLHYAVAHNKEVQVEVTNFRKDGSRWENVLTIVPIHWDEDVRLSDSKGYCKDKNQQQRYRYSVGFACDKSVMGM